MKDLERLINTYIKPDRVALDQALDDFAATDESDAAEMMRRALAVKAEMRKLSAPTN